MQVVVCQAMHGSRLLIFTRLYTKQVLPNHCYIQQGKSPINAAQLHWYPNSANFNQVVFSLYISSSNQPCFLQNKFELVIANLYLRIKDFRSVNLGAQIMCTNKPQQPQPSSSISLEVALDYSASLTSQLKHCSHSNHQSSELKSECTLS